MQKRRWDFKMSDREEFILTHKNCGAEVVSLGTEGISFCTECEHICEGETEYISTEDYEESGV
jgi:hypothetical protein